MIHLTKQTGGIMAAALATAMMLSGAAFVFPAQAEMQLAQAGQAPPAGATPAPANTPAPAMPKPKTPDQVEARIKALHDQLKITSDQEAQWATVAQAMRDSAARINDLIQQRAQNAKTMSAVDDLQSYQAIAQAHADGLSNLVPAFDTLYASMSDAQKKNADAVFRKRPHSAAKKSG